LFYIVKKKELASKTLLEDPQEGVGGGCENPLGGGLCHAFREWYEHCKKSQRSLYRMVVIVTLEAIKMHSRACIIWQLPLLYRSSNRERDNRGEDLYSKG
jgi:hypothetical protein